MPEKKLNVGIFSFTGDEGCVITFLEILNYKLKAWQETVNFKYCRVMKAQNDLHDLDVAFVEGAISNFKEEEKLKEIRANCKRLVAIGTCAINGAPSNHRNFFDTKTLEEIKPILAKFGHRPKVSGLDEIVKVDAIVPGCPIVESAFVDLMDKYLKEFGVVQS